MTVSLDSIGKCHVFVTGALTHAQKHIHINSRVVSLLITGESSSDDFDSMLVCLVCLCVCMYVDKFETLSHCEFLTYQHPFFRIIFFHTKLQVYEISKVYVKGKGHRGQKSGFHTFHNNSKRFYPIFI